MIWNVVKIANESGMNEITFDQKYRRFNKKKAVNQDLRLNERSSFFCLHGESTKMYNSLRKLTSTTGSNKTNSKRQHPTIGHRDHARCYWPRYLTWLREWDKNFGKLLTIAWLASSVCSSWNAVWSVWNKPLLKSQNVNQAVNHKSAFWSFYCYLGQPDSWFHEKHCWSRSCALSDSRSRGCEPWSRPFIGLWSLIPYTSLRPCRKELRNIRFHLNQT